MNNELNAIVGCLLETSLDEHPGVRVEVDKTMHHALMVGHGKEAVQIQMGLLDAAIARDANIYASKFSNK